MNSEQALERLIFVFKEKLSDKDYAINIYKRGDKRPQYKNFETVDVIKEFFKNLELTEVINTLENRSYNLKKLISLDNSKANISIDVCEKEINFMSYFKYKHEPITIDKKFLWIFPYTVKDVNSICIDNFKDLKKKYKDNGFDVRTQHNGYEVSKNYYFITFENLIFEITKDMADELKMFAFKALQDRSLNNLQHL